VWHLSIEELDVRRPAYDLGNYGRGNTPLAGCRGPADQRTGILEGQPIMSKAKKTLFMETTEVPAERTAAEISSVLIRAGATQIATDYEAGKITGLRWTMRATGRDLLFAMPARVDPIYKILYDRSSSSWSVDKAKLREKAQRVAWRQLLRWVQAQLAMIECGMTEASEVFFPYIQTPSGDTVYELFRGQGFKMLPAPEKPQ
jgi:hypothetical protein